ncbi:MAG: lysine transporter LysE [Chloroflexi bacterium HGW-Chloroflexi-10]|nr:MAG: lysine transporter LysE [Chloroflexi bacterium HGW-Chloroflexi-10]
MVNFFPFLAYVFVTSFTPGPNNILSMTYGMRYGYRGTLKFLLGIISGFTVLLLLCGWLNSFLASVLPQAKLWLNILGAVYMVYLAYHILRSGPVEENSQKKDLNSFRAGFILQFVNLKGILYGVTVYSIFITPSYSSPLQVVVFALILAVVGFLSISSWAIGGDLFRSLLKKHYRLFNLVMAALLVYTAIASLI